MLTTIYFRVEIVLLCLTKEGLSAMLRHKEKIPGKGLELELASDLMTPILLLATDKNQDP